MGLISTTHSWAYNAAYIPLKWPYVASTSISEVIRQSEVVLKSHEPPSMG